jgi:hypothetical protein
MKLYLFALKNSEDQIVRHIHWTADHVDIVERQDTHRIEFAEDASQWDEQSIAYVELVSLKTSQLATKLKTKPLPVGPNLKLVLIDDDQQDLAVRTDLELSEEDNKTLPLYLRYSAVTHVSVLILFLASAWIINRFTKSEVEPVVVQVFEQQREFKRESTPTVAVSKKKLSRENKQKTVARLKSKSSKTKPAIRPGVGVQQRGALAAFGGMSRQHSGSGGLNLKATKNNPGIGYGGAAAKGGHSRGMLGRGLVAAGVGSGGSLQGYGGTSRAGLGGGRPGYGDGGMAGSASSYYVPLSEDTLIEGGLDQDQINSVVQSHLGQVVNCYEQGLQGNPQLRGRVSVYFVINKYGGVSTARIANSSIPSSRVQNCIVAKLKNWKFPRPVGDVNVRVTYPFVLKRLSQG